jgi:hypothetical protein
MGGLWIQNLGKKLNLHKLVEVSPFRIITQIWYMLGINGCMCMYNPKYNSWNSWEAMGTFGSVKIERNLQNRAFLCWCTRSASWCSPGRDPAEACGSLREPARTCGALLPACCKVLPACCKVLPACSKVLPACCLVLSLPRVILFKHGELFLNPNCSSFKLCGDDSMILT